MVPRHGSTAEKSQDGGRSGMTEAAKAVDSILAKLIRLPVSVGQVGFPDKTL